MKVTLIANVSATGKVLLAENPSHQAPQEAIDIFLQVANRTGNLVIGKKTFEIFQQFQGGEKEIFSGMEVVLLSTTATPTDEYLVVSSPEEAIECLAEKGFTEIAVGGGTKTYNAFLDKDLATDIYFNIIPLITGNGGILGTNGELTTKFKLTKHQLLTDDVIQIQLTKAWRPS